MNDRAKHEQTGADTESKFSRMKRLLLVELQKPDTDMAELAKRLGIEHSLSINFDALDVGEVLGKLEALNPTIEKDENGFILPQNIETVEKFVTQAVNVQKTPKETPDSTRKPSSETNGETKNRSKFLVEVLTELNLPYEIKLTSDKKNPGLSDDEVKKWATNFGEDFIGDQVFILPTIQKMILVNNRGEHATYAIHDLDENCDDWETYYQIPRSKLAELGRQKITFIKYNNSKDSEKDAASWKTEVKRVLTEDENERLKDSGSERKTTQDALDNLLDAYKKWLSRDPETKGLFNHDWMKKNGFGGLMTWTSRPGNIPLQDLVKMHDNITLQEDFSRLDRSPNLTLETAKIALIQAYKEWSANTDPNKGKFNVEWILKNSTHKNLYGWSNKPENPSLPELAQEIGDPNLIRDLSVVTRAKFTRTKK